MTQTNRSNSDSSASSQPKKSFVASAKLQAVGLWAAAIATFIAIGVHAYLASRHYDLKFGEVNTHSLCNINATFNCEAVSASRFAEWMGVPMAVWGAFTNIALLSLMIFRPLSDASKYSVTRRNLLGFAGFIALMSLVMGGISTFLLSAFCPFCLLTYVLSFVTLGGLWVGLPQETRTRASMGGGFQFGDFMPLGIAAIFILLGGMIANDQIKTSYGGDKLKQLLPDAVAGWQGAAAHQMNLVEPLTEGASPAEAKMTISEFADYRCSHCKHTAPVMKAFVASHPKVRLEFQAWPLDGECNTSIPSANGASCMLARIVYCAQSKGGGAAGWKANEYVYDTQDTYFAGPEAVRAAIPQIAKETGVDAGVLQTCTDSPETKTMVSKQSAVGSALNLQGTPGIFVNGKEVPGGFGQSMPVLEAIYGELTK